MSEEEEQTEQRQLGQDDVRLMIENQFQAYNSIQNTAREALSITAVGSAAIVGFVSLLSALLSVKYIRPDIDGILLPEVVVEIYSALIFYSKTKSLTAKYSIDSLPSPRRSTINNYEPNFRIISTIFEKSISALIFLPKISLEAFKGNLDSSFDPRERPSPDSNSAKETVEDIAALIGATAVIYSILYIAAII